MKSMLSIVTNVSNADLPRIQHILPHWLTVFNDFFDELLIIYDNNQLTGRIGKLHQNKFYSYEEIQHALDDLKSLDKRVKVQNLDKSQLSEISSIWFKKGAPFRCNNGSPIYPFIYAIHHAKNDLILKVDCDIVFYENGFIEKTNEHLSSYDIVTPPRNMLNGNHIVSSRGFFIKRSNFYNNVLPLILPELSYLQKVSRLLKGQNIFDKKKFSVYFGFEDSLNYGIENKLLKHYHIGKEYGNSLHVSTNQEADDPIILKVIDSYTKGVWPTDQEELDMNYLKNIWRDFFKKE